MCACAHARARMRAPHARTLACAHACTHAHAHARTHARTHSHSFDFVALPQEPRPEVVLAHARAADTGMLMPLSLSPLSRQVLIRKQHLGLQMNGSPMQGDSSVVQVSYGH
eukprot:6182690-Pleurochrysis_carterae.AAC.5